MTENTEQENHVEEHKVLCTRCKKRPPTPPFRRCDICRSYQKNWQKSHYVYRRKPELETNGEQFSDNNCQADERSSA